MAVKGKKKYSLYLDEKETEFVKSFLITTRNKGGLSGLVNSYIVAMYHTLRLSGYRPGEKVKASMLVKAAKNGLVQNLA